MSDETNIEYYNQNADAFCEQTWAVDMSELYRPFEAYVPPKASILDVGCGAGRDALYFYEKGYDVTAFDYSLELVKNAQALTGLPILHRSFYEIDERNKYDGIWCCASLLHVPFDQLSDVLMRLVRALKIEGVAYLSFKYGDSMREHNGRIFTDLNEQSIRTYLTPLPVSIQKEWITEDQRPDRVERWLNVIIQKKDFLDDASQCRMAD